MEERYCQCCGMPMGDTKELYGTEKDGSRSVDYCKYCYEHGAFTSDCTMEEMIEFCVPVMVKENPGMSGDNRYKIQNLPNDSAQLSFSAYDIQR